MMRTNALRAVFRFSLVLLLFSFCSASALFAQVYRVMEMNTEQLRALDRERTVVLLPGAILEQHGPFLPSFTDGYMNERLTQEIASAIVERPGWSVLIFPLIPLGTGGANEIGAKYSFTGSFTVRSSTLRSVFMDIATELGESGFQWIFVIHLHGAPNHSRALDQAGDYFHDTYGGHMVHLFGLIGMGELAQEAGKLMTENQRQEEGFGLMHANMVETSLLLFLRPDLVSSAYTNAPVYANNSMEDCVTIAKAEKWPGYFGSPRQASAAFGARMWRLFSSKFVDHALKILDGFDYRKMSRYGDVTKNFPSNVAIDKAAIQHEQKVERRQGEWLRSQGLQ